MHGFVAGVSTEATEKIVQGVFQVSPTLRFTGLPTSITCQFYSCNPLFDQTTGYHGEYVGIGSCPLESSKAAALNPQVAHAGLPHAGYRSSSLVRGQVTNMSIETIRLGALEIYRLGGGATLL